MIFIGYDTQEEIAYTVCKYSLQKRTKLKINRLYSRDIPTYHRFHGEPQSTDFTFTRFWVPFISEYRGFSIFADCDFLFLSDPQELINIAISDLSKAVWVVKHPKYIPNTELKMNDIKQNSYERKNWASLMVFNNSHEDCKKLHPDYLNNHTKGIDFHKFTWTDNIGSLPMEWNCLDEYYYLEHPKAIHYTDGGPWFDKYKNTRYSSLWTQEFTEFCNNQVRFP